MTSWGVTDWSLLDAEIARWRDGGCEPVLWWRDDDAADAGPELERLLAVQHDSGVPLALAVIPAKATAALAARLAGEPAVDLLQHGYGHIDHAPPTDKKSELGTGWLAMERLFGQRTAGPRLLNVLVPPWNRIAPGLVPALPEIGFAGLSTFGTRARAEPVRGLRQVNAHLDLIDWHGTRGFVGGAAAIDRLVAALAAARAVTPSKGAEPIGILSHHLAMDEGAWDFLISLLGRTKALHSVKTRAAHELFASREARV